MDCSRPVDLYYHHRGATGSRVSVLVEFTTRWKALVNVLFVAPVLGKEFASNGKENGRWWSANNPASGMARGRDITKDGFIA